MLTGAPKASKEYRSGESAVKQGRPQHDRAFRVGAKAFQQEEFKRCGEAHQGVPPGSDRPARYARKRTGCSMRDG
jgi:hypothetical protein